MTPLNWVLVFVSFFLMKTCRGALIIEEEEIRVSESRAPEQGTAIEKGTERVRDFLVTYPTKQLSTFFSHLENCLDENKEEDIIVKPPLPPPNFVCVGLKDRCFASGTTKEFSNSNSSEKNVEVIVGGGHFVPPPPRHPPTLPSGRCCNGTLCRFEKCCIPTVSTAASPPCRFDSDCCDIGVCEHSFFLCKIPVQGSCTTDSQCLTGPCSNGKCCIKPNDSCFTCRNSTDCCGNNACVNGKCLANNGDYCNSNSQCSSGTCCSRNVCGIPTPSVAVAGSSKCTKNSDCCGVGICETISGTCRFSDYSPCTANNQCIHGTCYNNEKCCFDLNAGTQCQVAKSYCCFGAAVCKTRLDANGKTESYCSRP